MDLKLITNLSGNIRQKRLFHYLFILVFFVLISNQVMGQVYYSKLVTDFKKNDYQPIFKHHLTYLNTIRNLAVEKDASQSIKNKTAPVDISWIYPVIKNVGGVHPRPNLPVRPDPKVDYKIFVDIVSNERDPSGQYKGLKRLARLVNLMAYGKVPASQVHIVAVLDGESGYAGVNNSFYKKQFKAENPNLPIIHALKKAGVKLMICSQALAEHGMPDKIVDPDVTITLSALTDAVVYGQKGYIYMQM